MPSTIAPVRRRAARQTSSPAAPARQVSSQQVSTQQAVAGSQTALGVIFRLNPDAMLLCNQPGGQILEVSQRWENLFGRKRAEVIGHTLAELGLFSSQAGQDVLGQQAARGAVRELKIEMRIAGASRPILLYGDTLVLGERRGLLLIMRDLGEQRAQLAWVAVLGELSGALAHELNQPLAAILSNAQAARRMLARPAPGLDEIRAIVQDIIDDDHRAGEVIRRLRALFAKGGPELRLLDLNEVIRETLDLARIELISRKVSVLAQLDLGCTPCLGDRVQLQQVLLNLISNACEAMAAKPPGQRRLRLRSGYAGGTVWFSVADSGHGIAPAVMDRLFDSFFTTKPNGLGFGLSLSRTIVAGHGGRIEAANNAGCGASFRVTLPACRGESA